MAKDKTPQTGGIEFSERYDREDDIYYVTFKTGEPSCVMEHDDKLLLEIGVFTGRPTGFRILNFSKHRQEVAGFAKFLKNLFRLAKDRATAESQVMENRMGQFLEKVSA